MIYKVEWKPMATHSYLNEMDFILSKWNETDVQKIEDLVYDFLATLSTIPELGIYKSEFNCYS